MNPTQPHLVCCSLHCYPMQQVGPNSLPVSQILGLAQFWYCSLPPQCCFPEGGIYVCMWGTTDLGVHIMSGRVGAGTDRLQGEDTGPECGQRWGEGLLSEAELGLHMGKKGGQNVSKSVSC